MRLVPANLDIVFEEVGERESEFLREFDKLSGNEDDPLGAWIKRAKAKGDTKESDQVILTLLVELHRKFDELNAYIKNEKFVKLELAQSSVLDGINFENFLEASKSFIKTSTKSTVKISPKMTNIIKSLFIVHLL